MTTKQSPTELQKRLKTLEAQLENYRMLVANTPDLLYRTDQEGRICFVSPAVESLSGYTVEEALGMKMAEEVYLIPEERQSFLAQLSGDGHVTNFVARLKRKDGSAWWASTNAHFYYDHDKKLLGVEGITRDVSELKEAEEALQKSEELFRLAFRTSPDAINLNKLEDGVYLDINEGFTAITGYSRDDVLGRSSLELNIWRHLEDRQRMVRTLKEKGVVENLEAEFVGKEGRVIIGLMSARVITLDRQPVVLSITRNITEHKLMQLQLLQSQKSEAMGTMAGGIAHDFNNLLMGIQGRASLLGIALDDESPLQEHLLAIEEYVGNAAALTKQLLGIARRGNYEISPVEVNDLLGKCAAMFGRSHKELVISVQRSTDLKLVIEADRHQLEQALTSILLNSWQAMPRGGRILMVTTTFQPDRDFCRRHQLEKSLEPGQPMCRISLSDNGPGMSEEVRQRAFDPFFTTKELGRGTGLGLASAQGIVRSHGGAISLESSPGRGTSVHIYLPLSGKVIAGRPELSREGLLTGTETILLVDDEPMILEVGKAMLGILGYEVLVAKDGFQAMEKYRKAAGNIDLVVLDLIMPGMDGSQTFEALRLECPDQRVVLSTGYSMDSEVAEIMRKGCNGFIQKPFDLRTLSTKLRDVLDAELPA